MCSDWIDNNVDSILTTVTRIRFPEESGHATGFYYNHNSDTYLITNHHVLHNPDENHEPEQIEIYIRNSDNISSQNRHTVDISGGLGSDWYTRPEYTNADVAVVPINPVLPSRNDDKKFAGSFGLNSDHLPEEHIRELIDPGNRVMVLGYPGIFKDQLADLPVFRNTIISTSFGYRFNDRPIFVTDAKTHQGLSGSPVFFDPETIQVDEEKDQIKFGRTSYNLIGIHSSTFRHLDAEIIGEREYNLNNTWYIEVALEILEEIS